MTEKRIELKLEKMNAFCDAYEKFDDDCREKLLTLAKSALSYVHFDEEGIFFDALYGRFGNKLFYDIIGTYFSGFLTHRPDAWLAAVEKTLEKSEYYPFLHVCYFEYHCYCNEHNLEFPKDRIRFLGPFADILDIHNCSAETPQEDINRCNNGFRIIESEVQANAL